MHYQKYVKSHWCKLIHYDGRMSFTETYDLSKLRVMRKKKPSAASERHQCKNVLSAEIW